MSLNSVIIRQKLQLTLDSYVFGSSEIDDVVALALAASAINDITIMTVVDTGDLPTLELYDTASPVLCFVSSVNIFAISSNKRWLTLDGRLLRDDTATEPEVLLAWGCNGGGRLGDGTTTIRSSPVGVVGGFTDWCQVSAGEVHTAAVRTNGTLWAWGCNSRGQLGDDTITNRSSPVSVIGGFTDWCQVSAGDFHTAAVRTNGTLWTWGCNGRSQLGDGTTVFTRSSPVSVIGGFTDWCQVSAGYAHTVALRTNGNLWAWGYNGRGQLGDDTTINKSSPVSVVGGFTDWCQVSAGEVHTAAVRTNGTLWAWGFNFLGRLGDGTTTTRSSPVSVIGGFTDWCQVAGGVRHTAAVRTNGTLWAWGCGYQGQLGDNTTTDRSSPVSVVGGFTDWCQVAAGDRHTAAVRTNGTLWAWGSDGAGQLGINSPIPTSRSSPVSVVGGFTSWCQVSAGSFQHTAAVRGL